MNVVDSVKAYGCHDVVLLGDEPSPKHLDYLDLLKLPSRKNLKIDAVAEFQSRPLLYLIADDQVDSTGNQGMLDLQCLLANRGEKAYLGVLSPGELHVYPVNLDRSVLQGTHKISIKQKSAQAPFFFQQIISGQFHLKGQPEDSDYVFKTIYDLLSKSSKILINKHGLNPLDVLSFLGRSLFFRFLCDRGIVLADELHAVCPQADTLGDCFSTIENSIATSRWLDATFNGDLLPFSSSYSSVFAQAAEQTNGKLFSHLQAILKGWKHAGADAYQLPLDWPDLNFAHIPIGVLSQVYENFSEVWDSQQRQQTSVYYTPKNIAGYLVDDAFEGLANKRDAHILDPSCGAGIFLVLAFRKLVAAQWEYDGRRPDTKKIQSILYTQLCGFDVSESALRLAALSLYITAIELNESPRPCKSLKFPKPLKDAVLYNHRRPEEHDIHGFVLGSLRSDLPTGFNGRFDMVVGNPPWTRLKGNKKETKVHNSLFTNLTQQVLEKRGLGEIAKTYRNPDNNPDLPFLWKSTLWAKPEGIVAMALPGRIFLKQSEPGRRAFTAILKGIEVTGILNGSNLSDSAVWPGMNQPFMLFFARNRVPATNHHFHFVTPHFEQNLNDKGRIRIDYQSAQPVAASEIVHKTWLLKTLAIGTALDVEVNSKLDDLKRSTVKSFWDSSGLYYRRGYDISPKQVQHDASFMLGLPDFTQAAKKEFLIDIASLPKFNRKTLHVPKCITLYTPPMLIIPESTGDSSFTPKSWIVREPVVFSKSFYGFTAHKSAGADWVIAMLHLITHSELFRYHLLMTSSRMGAERRTILKETIEDFPFPRTDNLSKQQRQCATNLSKQLEHDSSKPWEGINELIFDLYGMDKYDRQIVKDTLTVAAPYKVSRKCANAPPTKNERKKFYTALQQFVNPSFEVTNETASIHEVEVVTQDFRSPWHFFSVSSSLTCKSIALGTQDKLIAQIIKEANKTGCSRVIVHEQGHLLVGIIGQYRYWTLSRARLCALDILRHHLDVFPVGRA